MSNQQQVDQVKRSLSKLLPYLGPYVIFLGLAREVAFYGQFRINIVDYLEVGEILTTFMTHLYTLIEAFVFLLAYIFVVWLIVKSRTKRLGAKQFPFSTLYIGMVLLYQFGVLYGDFWVSAYQSALFIMIFVLCFLVQSVKDILSFGGRFILFVCTFLLFFFLQAGAHHGRNLKRHQWSRGEIILLDNATMVANSKHYFVGKTKEYVFMYNDSLQIADVYPMNRVKELHLPYHFKNK